MKHSLTTILLSGGNSTRFFPFFDKQLTPFMGKPLLSWHYDQLVRLGLSEVIVVANKHSIDLMKEVPVPKKLHVAFALQHGGGQAQAIHAAIGVLPEEEKQNALILNASDIYEDVLLADMIKISSLSPDTCLLASVKTKTYFPGGYLACGEDGNVTAVVEKPEQGKEPSDIVRLNVDYIPDVRAFGETLKKYHKRAGDGYEEAITASIKGGLVCRPVITDTTWIPLKYPWHILDAMENCLSVIKGKSIGEGVTIGKNVIIEGPVIIEDGVKIFEGTKIVGPCFIGKDTIIGNNNIVRNSHIGSGCVTGFSTDITRSYIGNNCWFHTNFVGDSVISDNVSMGSGTVLANLRLDESSISSVIKGKPVGTGRTKLGACIGANVRIGVNVSVMPGIKIGKGSFVGAGVVLGEDLPEETYCHITPTVVLMKNTKTAPASRDQFKEKI